MGVLQQSQLAWSAGEGVAVDTAIAHDLFKRAAELGDPDAQADMGVRFSLGLQPSTGSETTLYHLDTPDAPQGLLHFFFGAAGNDSFAQMALGYRHMYGVNVPQSCQAGLLYYNPVAEQVLQASRYPNQLPQVLLAGLILLSTLSMCSPDQRPVRCVSQCSVLRNALAEHLLLHSGQCSCMHSRCLSSSV